MPRWISLALTTLLLLTPIGLAQDELRFDTPLAEGSAFGYRVEGDASFEIQAPFLPGGGQSESFAHTLELALEVVRSGDDGALIEARVLAVRVESDSSLEGPGSFGVEGDHDATAVSKRYAKAFTRAIDGVYTLVIDGERTITSVRAPEGILTGMTRDVRNAYERVLGTDRLREALQPVIRPPGAPEVVNVGDEWSHSSDERTALGQLTFTSTHRLDEIDDMRATCALIGSIDINAEGLGRNLTVERDDHTGALVWDVEAGVARSVRSDVDLRYSLSETPPIRASVASSDRIVRTDGAGSAEDQTTDDLTELLRNATARYQQPAMAAAVVSPERVVAIGVAGTRVAGVDNPVTLDDRWHIGSCTKAITATLLMRALDDAPDLSLSSTLADAFPDYTRGMHPRYRDATIADLLAHTAGLPTLTDGMAADRAALIGLPDDPREARATFTQRLFAAQDGMPYAPVNTQRAFAYSNGSFGVAAALTERLLGITWEEALAREVFAPLGMDRAGVGWPAAISATGEPRGHYPGPGRVRAQPADDAYELHDAIAPAGDVHATIAGWAAFAQDRLRAFKGMDSPVLNAGDTLALATAREGEDYAGGWIVANAPGIGTLYAHDGSAGTFYASVWIMPERDLAVLLVTNAGTGAEACESVRNTLLQRYAAD